MERLGNLTLLGFVSVLLTAGINWAVSKVGGSGGDPAARVSLEPGGPSRDLARPPGSPGGTLIPADADARLRLADLTRQAIETSEEKLAHISAKIAVALRAMQHRSNMDAREAAVVELGKYADELHRLAGVIIDTYPEYRQHLDRYRRELKEAPEVFNQAKVYFRQRKGQFSEPVMAANYDRMETALDGVLPDMAARLTELDRFIPDLEEMIAFVRQSREHFQDISYMAKVMPGTGSRDLRQNFEQQLRSYAKGVARFQKHFMDFTDKVKDRPFSSKLIAEREERLAKERAEKERLLAIREVEDERPRAAEAKALAKREAQERADERRREAEEAQIAAAEQLADEAFASGTRIVQALQLADRQARVMAAYGYGRVAQQRYGELVQQIKSADSAYRRTPVSVQSPSTAIASSGSVRLGGFYPIGRRSGGYGGVAKVVSSPGGGYELEAVRGSFESGDFLVSR